MLAAGAFSALQPLAAILFLLAPAPPGADLFSPLRVILAFAFGIVMSLLFLRTSNLWYPIAAHLGWSTAAATSQLAISTEHAPSASQQSYGASSDLIGIAVLGVAAVLVWRLRPARLP